jgi:hypothetical protein
MITGTNSSTAIACNYMFSIDTGNDEAIIKALKSDGSIETNDETSVRVTCFF